MNMYTYLYNKNQHFNNKISTGYMNPDNNDIRLSSRIVKKCRIISDIFRISDASLIFIQCDFIPQTII